MKNFWSLSKGDWVVLRVALLLAPVVALVTGVLPIVLDAVSGSPLRWHGQLPDGPVAAVPTLGGATVSYDGGVIWSMPDPAGWQWALAVVPGLEVALLVALGSWCLWRLVGRVRSGDAFGGDAVHYVRGLAVLVLCYALLVRTTRVVLDFLITAPSQAEPATYFRLSAGSLVALVLGLLLLALAECFRQGARLREDVEGLV